MIIALVLLYLIGGFLYAMVAVAAVSVMLIAVVLYGSAFLARLTYAKVCSHTPPTWNLRKPTTPNVKVWVEGFAKHGPLAVAWIVGLSVPAYFVIYMNTH